MKNRKPSHDNWETPKTLYDRLDAIYQFDHDPCPINGTDGLDPTVPWGRRNFVNPPYSRQLKEAFVSRAVVEMDKGNLSVMLLPVSTSTRLFHDVIFKKAREIWFVDGRVKFLQNGQETGTGQHDSMVVVLDPIHAKNGYQVPPQMLRLKVK